MLLMAWLSAPEWNPELDLQDTRAAPLPGAALTMPTAIRSLYYTASSFKAGTRLSTWFEEHLPRSPQLVRAFWRLRRQPKAAIIFSSLVDTVAAKDTSLHWERITYAHPCVSPFSLTK